MTPRVGQVIRLEDARGCWRLHTVSKDDKRFDDALELAGQSWSGLRFVRVIGPRAAVLVAARCARGPVLIFRAAAPAIGPIDVPYSELYRPIGWQSPIARTA